MSRHTISTFGPCCRCGLMARHILVVGDRRVIVHNDTSSAPCPVRPGEMPEVGKPRAVARE